MIFDPTDLNVCMNSLGVVFIRVEPGDEHVVPRWIELNELKRIGEYRQPEW